MTPPPRQPPSGKNSKVFTIPAGLPFVDVLAAGIRDRAGGEPEALAGVTVLVPTRRARRSLSEAFLRLSHGQALLLPKMIALGDLDEDEILFAGGFEAGGFEAGGGLDVKPALVPYWEEERERQQTAGVLGRYLIAGRFEGKPISTEGPGQAFRRMILAEGIDPAITIYSMRHSYATELLRVSDIRTVQKRLGHASIRTTELYLHEIEPEAHPTERLPW